MDSAIRELGAAVQSLVNKKIIAKYKINDLSKRMMDISVDKYAYADLYKQSVLLNIEATKYFHNSAKIPYKLLTDANDLYDTILHNLDNAFESKEQY